MDVCVCVCGRVQHTPFHIVLPIVDPIKFARSLVRTTNYPHGLAWALKRSLNTLFDIFVKLIQMKLTHKKETKKKRQESATSASYVEYKWLLSTNTTSISGSSSSSSSSTKGTRSTTLRSIEPTEWDGQTTKRNGNISRVLSIHSFIHMRGSGRKTTWFTAIYRNIRRDLRIIIC